MASIPQKDEVQRVFRPYEREVTDYLLQAWDRWWKNPDRMTLYRRSRACLIHNYTMNAAIPGFKDRKGVHVIEKPQQETAYFVIDQRLLFRIKKGDASGFTRNYPTQASLAFVDQSEDLSLFADLPDVWRVDIAYVMNYLQTKIEQIVVVARDEYRILWSYLIYGTAAEGEGPLSPAVLPVAPRTPPPANSGLRIPGADRVKKKKLDSSK